MLCWLSVIELEEKRKLAEKQANPKRVLNTKRVGFGRMAQAKKAKDIV